MAGYNIPGGAMSQVSRHAQDPNYLGLNPDQAQQARDMASRQPIPTYDSRNAPEYSPPGGAPPEEDMNPPEEEEFEDVILTLPHGEDVIYSVPVGLTGEEVVARAKAEGYWPEEAGSTHDMYVPPEPSYLDYARQGAQGMLFGASDELSSFLAAGMAKIAGEDAPFTEIYRDILETERYQSETMKKNHPGKALAAEIVGGFVTGGVGVAKAGASIGRQAGFGAGIGGLYGFNAADPTAETGTLASIGERVQGGAVGAAVGGVTGAAVGKFGQAWLQRNINKKMATVDTRFKLGMEVDDIIDTKIALGVPREEAIKLAYSEVGITEKMANKIALERGRTFNHYYKFGTGTDEAAAQKALAARATDNLVSNKLLEEGIMHGGATKLMDAIIEPIAERIGKISPRLMTQLRQYESKVYADVHEWHNQLEPFNNLLKKTKEADMPHLMRALYNEDFRSAKGILANNFPNMNPNELRKTFEDGMSLINQIGDKMEAVGAKFDRVEFFFPRRIKDLEGLKKHLGTEGKLVGYEAMEAALKRQNSGKGRESNALNAFLRGTIKSIKKKDTSQRSRKVVEVDQKMAEFYYEPLPSLDLFLRDAAQTIRRRELIGGKNLVDDLDTGVEDTRKSLMNFVDTFNEIGKEGKNEVADLLKIRFSNGEQGMTPLIANLRAAAHMSLLGNPVSAATQIGDVGVSAWINGFGNTMAALGSKMVGKQKIGAEDLGVMREMMAEISDPGSINVWNDRFFKASGFRAMDKLGKDTYINAAFRSYVKKAQRTKEQLVRELAPEWGEDTVELVNALEKGEINDITKQFLFCKLSETQPISRSEMPQAFLENPNGRIFYQLGTWTMKQVSLYRNRTWKKIKTPGQRAEGMKDMARALVFIGGAQMTAEETKRMMLGKESQFNNINDLADLGLKLLEGSTKNFGVGGSKVPWAPTVPAAEIGFGLASKTANALGAEEGAASDAANAALLKEAARYVPMVGVFVKYWLMGGAEEFNKKEEGKRKRAEEARWKF